MAWNWYGSNEEAEIDSFDEPVAGMTEGEVEKTVQMLNELKKTVTLLVVEHDMGFVRDIADVVTVMHMGTLLAQGSIKEIEKNKLFVKFI